MANFMSTADYLDSILLLSGEPINGNSSYESRAAHYLNRIHNNIIVGGNEFNTEVDEVWPWAVEREPLILELEPKYSTGTASVTNGSSTVTLSATTTTRKGWHIKFNDDPTYYKIISHTDGTALLTLDGGFLGTTNSATTFSIYKLEYELVPSYINLSTNNNNLTFVETTAGTEIEFTGTTANYTLATLLTTLESQFNVPGASTYDVAYDTDTRLFTITSDGTGGDGVFSMLGATASDPNQIRKSILPALGFGLKDYTGSLSYTSERALGSICRLVQPFTMHRDGHSDHEIYGIDPIAFQDQYPITRTTEGDPEYFTIVEERDDGYIKVRFNRYVQEKRRVYVTYVSNPLNLYDNSYSTPLIPRKYSQVLEYGAAAYLLKEKRDARAGDYFGIAGRVLDSMVSNRRRESKRIDPNFANIVAREDLRPTSTRLKRYGYTSDEW